MDLDPREYTEYYNLVADLYQRGLFDYAEAYSKLGGVLSRLGYPIFAWEEMVVKTLIAHNPDRKV